MLTLIPSAPPTHGTFLSLKADGKEVTDIRHKALDLGGGGERDGEAQGGPSPQDGQEGCCLRLWPSSTMPKVYGFREKPGAPAIQL